MDQVLDNEKHTLNRSHFKNGFSFEVIVRGLKDKIITRGDLPHISVASQLKIIDQLCTFPFGRYVLERKGANGFWTDYLIGYPKNKQNEMPATESEPLSLIEDFILNRSLLVLAHRERYSIYQSLIQKEIKEGVVLASIPCGLMRDLITLDFSKISDFKLVGLDIDKESLELARHLANENRIEAIQLFQQDAWQMQFTNEFDVITSSGLNVYESDRKKVLELYQRFFTALKPGGSLVISVLTYPPGEARETDWNLSEIPPADLLMENVLYKDILDLHWRNFRSSSELDTEFKEVGFSEFSVYFDKYRLFPTIHARKPK